MRVLRACSKDSGTGIGVLTVGAMRGEELLLYLGNGTLLQFGRNISNYLGADSLNRILLLFTRATSRVINSSIILGGDLCLGGRGLCSDKGGSQDCVSGVLLMMGVVCLGRSVGNCIVTLAHGTPIHALLVDFETVVGDLGNMGFSRTNNLTTALSGLDALAIALVMGAEDATVALDMVKGRVQLRV